MPKITISLQERLTFVPEGQDDVPEAERSRIFSDPLALKYEEGVYDFVQAGGSTGQTKQFNDCFRDHVVGWEEFGIPWDDAWARSVPDHIIAAFPMEVRGAFFSHLLTQAGLKGEVEVGKSE